MSNLPTARMEVRMAYRLANHRTEHMVFLEKLNVEKDWKHSFFLAKITTIFVGNLSQNFWITL